MAAGAKGIAGFSGTALLVVAVDQLTKAWALATLFPGHARPLWGPWLTLRLVRNSGAAFGVLAHSSPLLGAFGAVAVALTTLVAWRTADRGLRLGLALLAGGAVGNLLDRLLRGAVVDFLSLPFWPVFNVADASIVVGAALVLLAARREAVLAGRGMGRKQEG